MALSYCVQQILQHRQRVFQYLYRLVQKEEAADQLAMEVFRRTCRSGLAAAAPARLELALLRCATNLAFQWMRQNAETDTQRPSPAGVRRAVAALPAKERAAVLMHKYERLTCSEIATVMACRESAVKVLLVRAYEELRAELVNSDAAVCVMQL